MTAVAGLPMYDLPSLAGAHAAWWAGLALHLRAAGLAEVPTELSRLDTATLWSHPELLLAQTCGYPLTHGYAGQLRVVATPCYAAPGCEGSNYTSAIVVRADAAAQELPEVLGGDLAVNNLDSQSGYHAMRAAIAPLCDGAPPFRRLLITGGHVASLRAVAEGRADVCATDAVTHALLARESPDVLAGTRILAWTPRSPGLPYATRAGIDDETVRRLRDGLFAALADAGLAAVRARLLIAGAEARGVADYACIREMAENTRQRSPYLAAEVDQAMEVRQR